MVSSECPARSATAGPGSPEANSKLIWVCRQQYSGTAGNPSFLSMEHQARYALCKQMCVPDLVANMRSFLRWYAGPAFMIRFVCSFRCSASAATVDCGMEMVRMDLWVLVGPIS